MVDANRKMYVGAPFWRVGLSSIEAYICRRISSCWSSCELYKFLWIEVTQFCAIPKEQREKITNRDNDACYGRDASENICEAHCVSRLNQTVKTNGVLEPMITRVPWARSGGLKSNGC